MCNKYYTAIISPIERITHEFYVSLVIITWYIGSVIGSFVAIHLHTINRSRSKLVLLATKMSFIFCLLIETQLSIDSSLLDYFLMRLTLGILIGIIYSSSVIERFQSDRTKFNNAFTCATIMSITLSDVPTEMCCVSLTLVYSLITLNLSSSKWLFSDGDAKPRPNATVSAFHLIVKETRALIYLAGAKLLTIFCYFAPFLCITSQILHRPHVTFADINNTTTDQIFNDLVVLLLTRLALGTITIFCVRHNVNYSSIIYLVPLTTCLAAILFVPFIDLRRLITECTFLFGITMTMYVALSLFVDVIGHRAALCWDFDSGSVPKVISLAFATFIEHLVDVSFVIVYLHDWVSAKLLISSLSIISITVFIHNVTFTPTDYRITPSHQIL